MQKEFQIVEELTPAQKSELDKDIQELYHKLQQEPDFHQGRVKDVNININLFDEVFLNLTVAFGDVNGNKVKGRLTEVHKYPSEHEYLKALQNGK